MRKKALILLIFSIFYVGCSSSNEYLFMTPEEHFELAMKYYNDKSFESAINEFQSILLQYPGSSVIDDSQFYLAQSRFMRKEFIIAASEFSRLIRNMSASEYIPEAQFMLAECYYKLSPAVSLDQRYTKKAKEEYQAYVYFFPTHEKAVEAENRIFEMNEKLAQKEFNDAVIYTKLEYYEAAVLYFDSVIEIFHDTKYAPMASFNKIKVLIEIKKNNDALIEATKFVQRYPTDPNYFEVEKIKTQLESSLSSLMK